MQQVQRAAQSTVAPDSISEQMDFEQMLLLVGGAVQTLPEKQQLAYRLSREQGLSIAEIASNMNLAVSTVKNLLVIALKHIREALEKAGHRIPAWFL